MEKRILIVALSTILPLLVISGYMTASSRLPNRNAETLRKVNIEDLTVWHIGNYGSSDGILERLQTSGAHLNHLEVEEFTLNGTSEFTDLNDLSLVIFESEWISEQSSNSEVYAFIRHAVREGAKLASRGKLTFDFFQVLDKAGVNAIGRDETGIARNPAQSNPPLVAFKLKQSVTPTGHPYFYPSIFTCNSEDIDLQTRELINWFGG